MKAENKAVKTVKTYSEAVRLLDEYLAGQGMPRAVAHIRREHVEAFIADILARWKPATASNRHRALKVFFGWLVDEGEIADNPMARMRPPSVPDQDVPLLSDNELRSLIKACEGNDFEDRRDMAVIRLFIDCGVRRTELANLTIEDVDFDMGVISVVGKGARPRSVPFGAKTSRAVDRYLRIRSKHTRASAPALWLGYHGPMTDSGIAQIVKRRALQAGLGHIHPHQFRHTSAHRWLAAGGQENDLMKLHGWRSRQMVSRYASSAADERARAAHKRMALGDSL